MLVPTLWSLCFQGQPASITNQKGNSTWQKTISNLVCDSFRETNSIVNNGIQGSFTIALLSLSLYLPIWGTGRGTGQNIYELRPAENGTTGQEDSLLWAHKQLVSRHLLPFVCVRWFTHYFWNLQPWLLISWHIFKNTTRWCVTQDRLYLTVLAHIHPDRTKRGSALSIITSGHDYSTRIDIILCQDNSFPKSSKHFEKLISFVSSHLKLLCLLCPFKRTLHTKCKRFLFF